MLYFNRCSVLAYGKIAQLLPLLVVVGMFHTGLAQGQMRRLYYDSTHTFIKARYYVKDTIQNIADGKYESYFPNGTIQSRGNFQNNRSVGHWDFFYETGELKMSTELLEQAKSPTQYYTFFYKNGQKSLEGLMQGEERQGEWKSYSPEGFLQNQITYRLGTDSVYHVEYTASGHLVAQGYRMGSDNIGHWKYYGTNGFLAREGDYDQNKKTGRWKYYYPSGKPASVGEYLNDERTGRWTYFFENSGVSAKGEYLKGKKHGDWEYFNDSGTLLSRAHFEYGKGVQTDYYPSGNKKATGVVKDDKKEGLWLYFYEDGKKKGSCEFEAGNGMYYGYYPSGVLQTKGRIKDDRRVNLWEIYNRKGIATGYYSQLYNDKEATSAPEDSKPKQPLTQTDSLPHESSTRYPLLIQADSVAANKPSILVLTSPKTRDRKNYFEPRFPEYHGFIVQFNPFFTLLGFLPISFEFYAQERMGYEFSFEILRDPFFEDENLIPKGTLFNRGYDISIKQKFYNPINPVLMWYFGHELLFASLTHSIETKPLGMSMPVVAQASELRAQYGPMLGLRLMQGTHKGGMTMEAYVGVVIGYRNVSMMADQDAFFPKLNQDVFYPNRFNRDSFAYTFRFGFNFGYTLSADR